MAEAVAAVGLVVNVVQLLDWGRKIVKRLDEFQKRGEKTPDVFHEIKTVLPLLLHNLSEIQKQAQEGLLDDEAETVLLPVVQDCKFQCGRLDEVLVKTTPTASDRKLQRGYKALLSVQQEKTVESVIKTVQGYIPAFTWYQVNRAGRLNLGDYLHTTRSRSPGPKSRTVFLVPFERDEGYIDRTGIIGDLDDRLKTHRRVSLAGIGGVGKSQIAIEYCYRFQEKNPAANIFWVHAATLAQLDQGFRNIARKLSLPEWDDLSPDAFQIVSDWLSEEEHGSWLMVLDSADDIDLFFQKNGQGPMNTQHSGKCISEFVPKSRLGSILITTRDRRVAERLAGKKNSAIDVSLMSGLEAEELLRSKLDEELFSDPAALVELVAALDNLPLAISQAAAFMSENYMDVSDYLAAFKQDAADCLSKGVGDLRRPSESNNSLLSTWNMSFRRITQSSPRAADILSLMSVLDRNAIPKSLLVHEGESAMDFAQGLGTLRAFSLIITEKDKTSFALHRLVQISMRKCLESEDKEKHWQEVALKAMANHFPSGEFSNWRTCEILSAHAQIVIDYDFESEECLLRRAGIQHNLARFDYQQSRYFLAHRRYEEVISTRKQLLGVEHPDSLQSICQLGEVLYRESKYPQAETVLRQSFQLREKVLGPTHPDTLMNIGHLAEVLRGLKRYDEAEGLYRRALAGKEDDLGDDVIAMRNADNLGSVVRDAGRLEEAENWVKFAFKARERARGPTDPITLESISHLAYIARLRGNYDEAELQNKRALAGFEKELGREHHFTLRSLDDLSTVFWCQGKLKAAEEQIRRALRGLSKVLGPKHRRTLSSSRKLGLILIARGNWAEGIDLLNEVLRSKQEEFGIDSSEVLEITQEIQKLSANQDRGIQNDMARLLLEEP